MGSACSKDGLKGNACMLFVRKPEKTDNVEDQNKTTIGKNNP
jgi:hypothetical protein